MSLVLSVLPLLAGQEDGSGCTVGTLEDNCVSASEDNGVGTLLRAMPSVVKPEFSLTPPSDSLCVGQVLLAGRIPLRQPSGSSGRVHTPHQPR